MRVGTAVRARGLDAEHAPDVRQPGSQDDRKTLEDAAGARDAQRLRDHRRLAEGRAARPPVFDLDSVQLAASHRRAAARARHAVPHLVRRLAVQVPARGSALSVPQAREEDRRRRRLAITQVGWDADEVRRAEDAIWTSAGIKTPVLGNVYVLSRRAAERMDTGNPPGCWASPRARRGRCARSPRRPTADCRRGSSARRGRSRCSRASATPAPTSAAPTTRSTSRGSSAAPRSSRRAGKSCYDELQFGKKDGFYLYERDRAAEADARRSCPRSWTPPRRRCRCAVGRRTPRTRRCAAPSRALSAGSIGIRR